MRFVFGCDPIGPKTVDAGETAKGAPMDGRDERDYTPLACAVSIAGIDQEMLHLLIASGADVNAAVEHSKKCPLGVAACSGVPHLFHL